MLQGAEDMAEFSPRSEGDERARLAPMKRKPIFESSLVDGESSDTDTRLPPRAKSLPRHTVSSKERSAGLKWTRHEGGTRQRKGEGLNLLQVALNMEPGGSRDAGPMHR